MSARPHGVLLLFAMLAGAPVSAEEPPRQPRRIELTAEPAGRLPEIAIRPGIASLLLFDTRIARDAVELEGRERFSRVAVGEDTLTLLPSEALQTGEHLRLTVRFVSEAAPVEARFLLMVSQSHADTQVEVLRLQASPAVGMEEELQRLREENARLRSQRGPDGLAGVIAAEWMQDTGIAALRLKDPLPHATGAAWLLNQVLTFSTVGQVAVEVDVTFSCDEPPWSLGSAALIGATGHRPRITQVWQSEPTRPCSRVRLVVEAEAMNQDVRGPYTLELREAGGDRTLTVGPLRFPAR